MADRHFRSQIEGYSLTTAEILYRLPDHPKLIQSFLWQDYDLAPKFPRLESFLRYWEENLEGPLYRVTVSHRKLISPAEVQLVDGQFLLH